MEKILLAIDAIKPAMNTLKFACYLGLLTKSPLTGMFLENIEEEERQDLSHLHKMSFSDWSINNPAEEQEAKIAFIESNINRFEEECKQRGVTHLLHYNGSVPVNELIAESRFADVLVVDAATSITKQYEGTPSEFVAEIINNAACPVLIAPEMFEAIDEIIFSYNDTASAVFAIKQFAYLFPQLNNKRVTIVQVNDTGKWEENKEYNIKDWLKDQYSDLHFEILKGNTESKLLEYFFAQKNRLLVMGAYGRNALSNFFNNGYAETFKGTVSQPIFITPH